MVKQSRANGDLVKKPEQHPGRHGKKRTLAGILGKEVIASILHPFVDYLETSVAAYERNGTPIDLTDGQTGGIIAGNGFCRILLSGAKKNAGQDKAFCCVSAGRKVALAAVNSGCQEEVICQGGMTLAASPILAADEVVGACVGCISEPPTDEEVIRAAADACGVDYKQLWKAANQFYHKPDYLYDAARNHLKQLAQVLGYLYLSALKKEEAAAEISRREDELAAARRVISATTTTLDEETILTRAAESLRQSTGADFVLLLTKDGKLEKLRLRAVSGKIGPSRADKLKLKKMGGKAFNEAAQTGETQVVCNLFAEEKPSFITAEKNLSPSLSCLKSLVAVPLKFQEQTLGVVGVLSSSEEICTPQKVDFIELMADQLSISWQNSKLFSQAKETSSFLSSLLDSMTEAAYTCDFQRNFTYLNAAAKSICGYEPQELIGKNVTVLIPEDQMEKLQKMMSRRNAGMVDRYDIDIIRKDGTRITINQTVSPLYREGKIVGIVGVATDVSKKRETERRLNLLAAAVENTHEGVIVSDLHGDILFINAAGAHLLGYEPQELIGMHMGQFWSDKNPEGLREQIISSSLGGGWEGQIWYKSADGSDIPAFVSSSPLNDSNGNPIALVGISRDITSEQRMTEEIMRRNRELAVLNAVAATAAMSLDLESILHSCIISVVDSMSYDGGIIYLLDSGCKYLMPGASRGFPNDLLKLLQKVEVGSGYAGTVAKTGKPLFVEQEVRPTRTPLQIQGTGIAKTIRGTREDSNQVPLGDIDKAWWSSLGFIPIISKDRLLGVMEVTTSKPHKFTEAEKSLLGSVGKTIGVAIDNARLFKDVASAKAEWETTFDAMTNGVSIHNCNLTIVRANKALAKLLGISAKELVGKQCYEVFHGRLKPIVDCPHKKAVLTGKNATLIREEPSLGKILSISADPIFDAEGNVVGTVHDVRDITEQEQLRDQLNQTEKLTALGEMAGGVAHDFNNFLTVILGNAQLLLSQSDLNSEDREALKTIERAAGDAAETVRRIQEFTRVRTTRRFTAVNVNEVITNAIEVARPRWKDEANARGAKIELSVKLADVPLVSANESELGEVIINLLLNAADALPEGGNIAVKSRVQGDWVEVLVADNGRGMVEDVRRRIFEPFFTTKGSSGSGLGLSVAYGIVKRHRGEILVESKEGEGTVFTVRLPVASVVEAEESQAELPEEAVRSARVLVIDDAAMVRTLLVDILEGMKHKVQTAESGPEGIAMFKKACSHPDSFFDVVLTDLGMPGMSGWEVAEEIKKISPRTPVVLITGWGDQLEPEKMEASKVDTVIAKPFRVEEIHTIINQALAGKA